MSNKPFEWREMLEEIGNDSHAIYLANWETKTLLAENNGEFTNELHFRTLEAIEKLASNAEALTMAVNQLIELNALKTLD